jgi:hypothetical protein
LSNSDESKADAASNQLPVWEMMIGIFAERGSQRATRVGMLPKKEANERHTSECYPKRKPANDARQFSPVLGDAILGVL